MRSLPALILTAVVMSISLTSMTALAGPIALPTKKPTATATATPALGPVCSRTRCVLGPVGDKAVPCSKVGEDASCYALGCIAGNCQRIEIDNPNLLKGNIPPCSSEGTKCGKTYCEQGGPGVGYICRFNSNPPAGSKECSTAGDCYGSKCVLSADKLSLSCEVDKFTLTNKCVVGTPEGCMEKRCLRSGNNARKVCRWVRPGIFNDDKENPRCDEVDASCGGTSSARSSSSSSSSPAPAS